MATGRVLLAWLPLLLPRLAECREVSFRNTGWPMADSTGQLMDAHDGSIQRFSADGAWYMHAVTYGLCQAALPHGCDPTPDHCGFRQDHNISVYTSDDLSNGSWRWVSSAIDMDERPPGTVFRPSLVFNPHRREYTLWWNYVHPNGTYAGFAAATSHRPEGPFKLRTACVNITYQNASIQAGDFHLFVDDDGEGYVIYSAAFYITIERLNHDFVSTSGGVMFDGFRGKPEEWGWEAPVLFKRQGVYYAMFGPMCCFCYQGSGIRVYTASSPLGPYTYQGQDLACSNTTSTTTTATSKQHGRSSSSSSLSTQRALSGATAGGGAGPEATPAQGCLFYGEGMESSTRSQQNYVIEVERSDGGGVQYVWTGDRWGQSPDGIKGHEPQFWAPLHFDEEGRVGRVQWVDGFTLDVKPATTQQQQRQP